MPTSGEKYEQAAASLPEDLRPIFRRFVEEYEYVTMLTFGRGYVAYQVLAELVKAGWRPSAERLPDSRI